jgi:hypothetical protein
MTNALSEETLTSGELKSLSLMAMVVDGDEFAIGGSFFGGGSQRPP